MDGGGGLWVNMLDWKYVWRKDHGYFTFAEVVCGTWLESNPDPSSGGVHTCSLLSAGYSDGRKGRRDSG
jgi:hypothetical protein